METKTAERRQAIWRPAGSLVLGVCLAIAVAACGSGTASPTPDASAIAAATPTPTPTPAATPAPTPGPTASPTPEPTPGPLCSTSRLLPTISLWDRPTAGTRGRVMLTSTATTTCYMRGTAEAQMVNGGHAIIADSGAASAGIASTDPFFAVYPADKFHTTVIWSNWCTKGPTQPVTVALVLPEGLGRVVANTSGPTPAPACVSSGSPSAVTSTTGWAPGP